LKFSDLLSILLYTNISLNSSHFANLINLHITSLPLKKETDKIYLEMNRAAPKPITKRDLWDDWILFKKNEITNPTLQLKKQGANFKNE
jgi:hypothetical protein